MMNDLEQFYLNQLEPERSCFLALRQIILDIDEDIVTDWKYRTPFFCYKGKRVFYLWLEKETRMPYIGIVIGYRLNHPALIKGNRSHIKILRFDPTVDLPIDTIRLILHQTLDFYRNGIIKVKR